MTKGQLRKIIAEEYAAVNRQRRRQVVGKKKTRKQHMTEAKRQMIVEIQARALSNEILEEGFLDSIKAGVKAFMGLGGEAMQKAGEQAAKATGKIKTIAGDAKDAASGVVQALADKGNDALAKISSEFLEKLEKELSDKVVGATQELAKAMKEKDPEIEDEAVKAAVSAIVTGALGGAQENLAAGRVRTEKRRLNEMRRKRRR